MTVRTMVCGICLILLFPTFAITQPPGSITPERTEPARPAPRRGDGSISLGAPPGQPGFWDGMFGGVLSEDPDIERDGLFLANPEDVDRVAPFKPWARALFLERTRNLGKNDPHIRCSGSGGPRAFDTPFGFQLIHDDENERIIMLIVMGRNWREIFMDGRPHPDPADYTPTIYGHSIGHWEDDTLVIDTVGFNDKFWFARKPLGIVHTDALHLIERISRPSHDRLHYEVTVDDPKAYTRPWTASWELPWSDAPIIEYMCNENNRDAAIFDSL